MNIRVLASSAALVAGLAALPLGPAKAQYYYYPPPPAYRPARSDACWFPLFWPFCAAGAVVGTAGAIATAPFRAVAPRPYYYSYYGTPYYYSAPYSYSYYPPG